jgi:hypothetical protein
MMGAYGLSTLTRFNGYGSNIVQAVGSVLNS